MPKRKENNLLKLSSDRVRGTDENHMAEWGFLPSQRSGAQKTIVKTDKSKDRQTGKVRVRKWIITAGDHFGLPCAFEEDLVLALLKISSDYDAFSSKEVPFTQALVLRTMKRRRDGASYKRLKLGLDRLVATTIKPENSFWNKNRKKFESEAFHLLDAYRLEGEEYKDGRARDSGSFKWSDKFHGSLRRGHLRQIDLDTLWKLRTPIGKRLYRFLSKRFGGGQNVYYEDLMTFCNEKLGLTGKNYRYPSQVLSRFEEPHNELKRVLSIEVSVDRVGEGYTVRYVAPEKRGRKLASDEELLEAQRPPQSSDLVEELERFGLAPRSAIRYSRDVPRAQIRKWLVVASHVAEHHPEKIRSTKEAFLCDYLQNFERDLPAWIPEVVRRKALGQIGVAVVAPQVESSLADRNQEERQSLDWAERSHRAFNAFLELPQEERRQIEAEAFDEWPRALSRPNTDSAAYRDWIVRAMDRRRTAA